ncbi:MAG: TetR/AcrR family transcriptional regulator [Ilumatobacteraceae bacterium]
MNRSPSPGPDALAESGEPASNDGAADVRPGRRRQDPRRQRTPQRLIAAARIVFERDGFHDARLADVTKEAGVSTGTLYNYFQSKEELFRAVVQGVLDELTTRDLGSPALRAPHRPPVEAIFEANRQYVPGYRRNARLMSLLSQVAERDPEVRAIGLTIREHFESRISRAIARWQAAGLAYADLDPVYTANALAYMVDRFVAEWAALGLPDEEDEVADTLSTLWVRSLGLADGPRRTT